MMDLLEVKLPERSLPHDISNLLYLTAANLLHAFRSRLLHDIGLYESGMMPKSWGFIGLFASMVFIVPGTPKKKHLLYSFCQTALGLRNTFGLVSRF